MKTLSPATLSFAFFMSAVYGLVVEPFLSLPGNQTVVFFIDLHLDYHDNGSCSSPDWKMFEMAFSLEWKTLTEKNLGLTIYDTCGSADRARLIMRQMISPDACNETDTTILGIIAYLSNETTDAIKDVAYLKGIPYIDAKNDALIATQNRMVDELFLLLNHTRWSYITTIADNETFSLTQHTLFLSRTKENNICVQHSIMESVSTSDIVLSDVKTPGVVVFTSDLTKVGQNLKDLPDMCGVIILTQDRREFSSNLTNEIIILRDIFPENSNFSNYMIDSLSTRTNKSLSLKDYFVSRHNCSWNSSSYEMSCDNPAALGDYFLRRSSEFDINTVLDTLDVFVISRDNQSSSQELPGNKQMSISAFKNGTLHQSTSFSLDNSTNTGQILSRFTDNQTFPSSQCEGWCPSCTVCTGHVTYDGDYLQFPGDILLAGLFPIRTKGERAFQCGAVDFNRFSDIYAAAFKYAIELAHARSAELLPNVSVGGVIFDTCSDGDLASRTLLNFESCMYSFPAMGNSWAPNPQIVSGYIIPQYASTVNMGTFSSLQKLGIGVDEAGALSLNSDKIYEPSSFNYSAVVELLKTMDWTYVGLITSMDFNQETINGFLDNSMAKNICIAYRTEISTTKQSSVLESINLVRQSPASVVILFAKSDAIRDFFRTLTYKPVNKLWILVETRDNVLDGISAPLGSIIFHRKLKQNPEFNQFYSTNSVGLPWEAIFKKARDTCIVPDCKKEVESADTWMRAADIIKSVDILLNAIHHAYAELCPELQGLCREFLETGPSLTLDKVNSLVLEYHGDFIDVNNTGAVLDAYVISSVQIDGLVQVGSWSTRGLTLDKGQIKFYTVDGVLIQRNVDSYCASECNCINNHTVENNTGRFVAGQLDPEMGFVDSSAEFDRKLWCIIVIIIALSGCVMTLGMMGYIMCKVCAGGLIRRYLVLGVLLLIAMILMFLSVLPFVFTPTEVGCGMRFLAHGISYAFCYAIMLTKMTSLRDYKYIGLGGDVSRLNQLLFVFFITGVQIAIGVQWWVLQGSMLIQTTIPQMLNSEIQNVTYYACDFERKDFIAYHSYVILLLVMCCFYSITVRKETNNMKEARLLLVCSWFCLALWTALVITFLILKRDYLEPIASIGLLANALSMMVIIYLPKLTVIARLKYEISEKGGKRMENGYKVDTDFQFERPYSLPGTMHTTFTDKNNTLTRSLAAFDSSLSY